MRYSLIAATTALAAAGRWLWPSATGMAQAETGLPNFKPPPMAPVKPYQAVAVTLPKELNDPGFVAFRKQLGEIAEQKDNAALGKSWSCPGLLLDAGQGRRRQKEIRPRQSRQRARSRRQGRLRAGRCLSGLCQRADRRAAARPAGRRLRAGGAQSRSQGVRGSGPGDQDRAAGMGLSRSRTASKCAAPASRMRRSSKSSA